MPTNVQICRKRFPRRATQRRWPRLDSPVRSIFLLVFVVAGMVESAPANEPETEKKKAPNILLIMADDLGYSDLGCFGSQILTPNLDSIAAKGIRFTQFYNTARCWPTRGALLTGFYAQQIRRDSLPGVPSGGNRGRRPSWANLLPNLIRDAGYRSYHTGKWHIDGMPLEQGFDRSYYVRDQGRFFNPTKLWKDDKPLKPIEKGSGYYATIALADHVIETLEEHQQSYAGRPFFHYLAFAAPHFPLQALPQDIEKYKDMYKAGWDTARASRFRRQKEIGIIDHVKIPRVSRPETDLGPPYHFPEALEVLGDSEVNRPMKWNALSQDQKSFQATKMAIHAAMIHRMDVEIGRVFKKIRDMGEWENTLVLFLSDNGASAEIMVRDDGHDPKAEPGSAETYLCLGPGFSTVCNTPFRRHKTWTHEGGISTPLLVSWPKGIPVQNKVCRTPGHVVDIVPTLLEITGGKWNPEAPKSPGQSLTKFFQNPEATSDERTFWWFHDGHRAIRKGNWKAVAPVEEPWELYEMSNDRIESQDLAVPKSTLLNELTNRWEEMRLEIAQVATADLDEETQRKSKLPYAGSKARNAAQAAALPRTKQVLVQGHAIKVGERNGFLMEPSEVDASKKKPWVFYAPTLRNVPDKAESWLHEQLLNAGIAVAGIDVGEAYGSPAAFPFFDALYSFMENRGYSAKPVLLGRSRGGLWVSSWAIANPHRVAGIGGIYPVYDIQSYPGIARAASAFNLSAEQLKDRLGEFNPVDNAAVLAKSKIPIHIIHGTVDKIVPIEQNSAALEQIYTKYQASDQFQLERVPEQGHNYWEGFFKSQELVDFLITSSRAGATK